MSTDRDDPTVSIRLVGRADIDGLVALGSRNDPEPTGTGPQAEHDAAEHRSRLEARLEENARGTRRHWVIEVDGLLVGDIQLNRIDRGTWQTANVGYLVDAAHRGRGIASQALRLVIRECFDDLRLHRLDAGALMTNVASQRVLEKAGFRRIGIVEKHFFEAGEWRDYVWYELIGPDVPPDLTTPEPPNPQPDPPQGVDQRER
jgi:[ribosomal protein S5]-alanine N-acetyltransferase